VEVLGSDGKLAQ